VKAQRVPWRTVRPHRASKMASIGHRWWRCLRAACKPCQRRTLRRTRPEVAPAATRARHRPRKWMETNQRRRCPSRPSASSHRLPRWHQPLANYYRLLPCLTRCRQSPLRLIRLYIILRPMRHHSHTVSPLVALVSIRTSTCWLITVIRPPNRLPPYNSCTTRTLQ